MQKTNKQTKEEKSGERDRWTEQGIPKLLVLSTVLGAG